MNYLKSYKNKELKENSKFPYYDDYIFLFKKKEMETVKF